jgi:hypothetical protein
MYEGTLASKGPWQALVTFQQFIVLANRHGEVDMTPEAISNRTTIPLEIIKRGIEELEKPDLDSRTPAEEGRRIVRLSGLRSWGWRIVNYDQYNKLRSEEERREYFRNYRQQERTTKRQETFNRVQSCSTAFNQVQDVTPVSVSVDVKEKPSCASHTSASPAAPQDGALFSTHQPQEGQIAAVERVWAYYLTTFQKNPKVLTFTALRKQKGLARLRECMAKTTGDMERAEALMRLAIDTLAASPFHRGENDRKRKYDSWEANLFKSQEQLEGWLERAA